MGSKVSKDAKQAKAENATPSNGDGKAVPTSAATSEVISDNEGVQTNGKHINPETTAKVGDIDKIMIASSSGDGHPGNATIPAVSIDGLIESRRSAFQRKVRDRVNTQLKAITDASFLNPNRPYGLPTEMAGNRMHIWDLIFGQVDNLESIVNLRQVCLMFNELLERKYVATMMPQVWWNHFENQGTHSTAEYKDWTKTLRDMRTLSKASKNSVDSLIERGMIGVDGAKWFSMDAPHFKFNNPFPFLRHSAFVPEEGRHLAKSFTDLVNPKDFFPWRAFEACELGNDGAMDLPSFRSFFKTVCEKVGTNVISLLYKTEDKSFEAYDNVRRWVAFMPNLKDLIVELKGEVHLRSWEITGRIKVKPFPTCRSLKRYGEGYEGFGVPFFVEIIRANPTIQEVLLGATEFREWESIKNALDTLQLTKFHITSIPDLSFFEKPFEKPHQLTTLALWNPAEDASDEDDDISSKQLFKFISSCANLTDLLVSMPYISGKEGYLKLPELKHLTWKVFPTFKSLGFLKLAENLQLLDLDMSVCPDTREKEEVMEFLGEWNIPSLFLALRSIRIRTQHDGPFKGIWTRGST